VAAVALDADREGARRRHQRARPGDELALRVARGGDVQAVGGVDVLARRRQDAFVDHVAGTVPALFAGLEHEHDVAGQVGLARGEEPGGADQPRGVQVVTAGVHGAVERRGELLAAGFGDRERVHVAAQQDGAAGPAAAQDGGDRREVLAEAGFQTEPVQRREHALLGARQVQADLGDAVQVAAEGDQLVEQGGGVGAQGHPPIMRGSSTMAGDNRQNHRSEG
jgi:hypothetical protein